MCVYVHINVFRGGKCEFLRRKSTHLCASEKFSVNTFIEIKQKAPQIFISWLTILVSFTFKLIFLHAFFLFHPKIFTCFFFFAHTNLDCTDLLETDRSHISSDTCIERNEENVNIHRLSSYYDKKRFYCFSKKIYVFLFYCGL